MSTNTVGAPLIDVSAAKNSWQSITRQTQSSSSVLTKQPNESRDSRWRHTDPLIPRRINYCLLFHHQRSICRCQVHTLIARCSIYHCTWSNPLHSTKRVRHDMHLLHSISQQFIVSTFKKSFLRRVVLRALLYVLHVCITARWTVWPDQITAMYRNVLYTMACQKCEGRLTLT